MTGIEHDVHAVVAPARARIVRFAAADRAHPQSVALSTASTGNTTPVGVTTTLGPRLGASANEAMPSGGRVVVVVS